ncbi:aminodeoxychorismate lyase [Fulvimonas soli]|jgi:4-amino-4-deoxychorismate lyase|uniref:Aminodeoxychorismate lyase n=1 Tax=Fulvimonas soli TaxID=155197 RepID=A0A316IAW2_9GAMM|nr:aminodeoxychorismate lyase [Fulvimonas soli]PWK89956.1 aminodeoxychorismate lyase apoprotein [Fulvimonas soli]TNY25391.1 aminodeoxychorismate lyase [Fulvimonas soli]
MDAAPRMRVNGVAAAAVGAADRGLAYGDGLFETVRFVGAGAPLWARHMERLARGCARLGLPPPDPALLLREARAVGEGLDAAVVRITLTRGEGPRGYAPPAAPSPTRIVAAFPPPPPRAQDYRDGVRVRTCGLRLAEQPRLAGLKHLNRLEQVLARAEWNDPAIAEGLLLDAAGRVVSATAANLFAVLDGELVTPALDRCGVAGVARAEIMAVRAVREAELKPDRLAAASELFLSSSVRGILPVRAWDARACAVGPVTRALQRHWRELGFPMEAG